MDSGTSTIFGVATSDRVIRVYNAVISTGREARHVDTIGRIAKLGWCAQNKLFVETLERIVRDNQDPAMAVRDARNTIRVFMAGYLGE